MNLKKENITSSLLLKTLFTIVLLACFVFLGVVQLVPPAAKGLAVPAGQFSASQAFQYLQHIAEKTRPLHSAQKEKVRDYIIQQLQGLGFEVEVQKSHRKDDMDLRDWNLENILTRIKGTASSGALLVVSHYDSVPSGPGASDDGAAVAATITSLSQLRNKPPLKNDLIVLFSDGEEYGMLGAYQFALEHPWAKEVALVFNYEARGHKGPSVMFQTNDQNGWVIAEFAKAAPYPIAYSWSGEVYKRMPNNTDFTVFADKGLTGLNFAYIGGWKYYHSANDNLKNVSLPSLQHHGENMLPLLSHFGNLDLKHTKAANRVYFSIFNTLVHYPGWLAYLFMILAVVGFIAVLYWGVKIKEIKITRLLLGFLLFLLVIAVSAFVLFLVGKNIRRIEPDLFAGYCTGALACLALGVFSLFYYWFMKRLAMLDLFAGALVLFFIMTIVTVFLATGASYLFTWPLIFGILSLILLLKRKNPGWGNILLQCLLVLPTFLVLLPSLSLTVDALGIGFSFAVVNLFFMLLASVLIPHLQRILKQFKWWFPVFFLVAGMGMLLLKF